MRLIDADALLAIIEEEEKGLETSEFQLAAIACINHIKEAPTVKAWTRAEHNADAFHAYVEGKKSAMKHGEWLEKEVSRIALDGEMQSARCSCCGLYHTTPFLYYFTEYKYCPNCGAKMDGGDENETD